MAGRPKCSCGTCLRCIGRIKSANQRARKQGDFEAIVAVPPLPAQPKPLARLEPGRYVSGGGFLDYKQWPDRDRFVQLDKLIYRPKLSKCAMRARNLRILAAIDEGTSYLAIARRENVTYSTVTKVKQHRDRFQKALAATNS